MIVEFENIYERALARFDGDQAALEAYLPVPCSEGELKALSDDRYLSVMSQRIFRAGLRHAVVDAKWPYFEEAFWGFEPQKMVLLDAGHFERLMSDKRLIRHLPKMKSIPANAQMILDISAKHGSFGNFIANWPVTDIVSLWLYLQERGMQLGGQSAAAFLRMVGKDTFMLDKDMTTAVIASGVVPKVTTTEDRCRVQGMMNALHENTGRPMCHLSMLLSLSIGKEKIG